MLPEAYSGETSWEDWAFHFGNVAAVNSWTAAQKLQWLKVRLTGRAQRAFQHLSDTSRESYEEAMKALRERFEPKSRQSRYEAEFQTRRKKKSEGWSDFAEDLKLLADKAFPELQEAARSQLAINSYLQQLDHPQVAFGVKQKRPKTIDEAVSATLEMESYVTQPGSAAAIAVVEESETTAIAAATQLTEKLSTLVEKLTVTERVERLELNQGPDAFRVGEKTYSYGPRSRSRGGGGTRGRGAQRARNTQCWNCGLTGHIARNCRQNPGN